MALTFGDFSALAEQNPAQYMELMNALQQTYSRMELEAQFAENMAKYYDYAEVIPNEVGHTFIDTGTRIAGEYMGPVSSSTETALELATEAYDYEVLSAEGQVLYRANMGAMETGVETGVYQSASLLSLDVGVVGAAVAPLLGVALGAELYQANPQFWTQLSQKLLPFCYPGTTEIPGWLDIVDSALHPGQKEAKVIIDKSIVEAVKEFLDDIMGVPYGEQDSEVTVDGQTLVGPIYRYYVPANSEIDVGINSRGGPCILSNETDHDMIISYSSADNVIYYTFADNYSSYAHKIKLRYLDPVSGNAYASTVVINESSGNVYGSAVYGSQITTDPSVMPFRTTILLASIFGIGTVATFKILYYLQHGEFDEHITGVPEGTSEWEGYTPSLGRYSKPIIYMVEDPNNPGSFIPEAKDGIEIALPDKSTWPKSEIQSTRPENWPEGVQWPTEMEFPWPKPADYEGDWPASTTWPLPADKPDYWPDGLSYPRNFSYPAPSNDPNVDPDPNQNSDPSTSGKYIDSSQPDTTVDPSTDPEPQPEPDPSKPNPSITTVIPADPPGGRPGTPEPPQDDGETPVPVIPSIDLPFTSANDGLISVYHPTDAQLKAFAQWLWVTYADPSIEKLWNNPFDGVIGLMELYCTPTDVGAKTIRSGFLDSGVSSQTISRYTEIDCGSIYVPEYYNNYLDYSPYSKAHVYLPFIGIVELNVDDVVGHGINITYKIDEYNGACIAIITCARHTEVNGDDVDYSAIVYQFSGNCAVELPLAGGTQAAIRAGLIQAAAYGLSSVIGGIVSGVSGNIGGAVSQIGYGAANAIGSVVSAKSSVQHSGSFGSSYGALGLKVPFVIVSRPKQLQVINYPRIYGYPAHAGVTIGSCRGYLRVREVHVLSATATDEEKKRIEDLLKEGVYVTE